LKVRADCATSLQGLQNVSDQGACVQSRPAAALASAMVFVLGWGACPCDIELYGDQGWALAELDDAHRAGEYPERRGAYVGNVDRSTNSPRGGAELVEAAAASG